MSNHSPSNNPLQWFFNGCLLILFGVIALSVSVHLLQAIWPWVLGFIVVVGGITAAVVVWRAWRRPW
jgi:membrane protein implicated in regulation of membrane protease activity